MDGLINQLYCVNCLILETILMDCEYILLRTGSFSAQVSRYIILVWLFKKGTENFFLHHLLSLFHQKILRGKPFCGKSSKPFPSLFLFYIPKQTILSYCAPKQIPWHAPKQDICQILLQNKFFVHILTEITTIFLCLISMQTLYLHDLCAMSMCYLHFYVPVCHRKI